MLTRKSVDFRRCLNQMSQSYYQATCLYYENQGQNQVSQNLGILARIPCTMMAIYTAHVKSRHAKIFLLAKI